MHIDDIEKKLREEQISGEAFIFGPELTAPHKAPIVWNPDSETSMNPSLLMCGTSGSGKSTLLKEVVKYLQIKQKNIYLFDLQGDLRIDGENHIEFTAWNSEYGEKYPDYSRSPSRNDIYMNKNPYRINKSSLVVLKFVLLPKLS